MTARIGTAQAIDRISITVPDLAAAERFFCEALGFATVNLAAALDAATAELLAGRTGVQATAMLLRLGRQHLELLAFDPPGRPYPADSTSSDLWFQHCAIVVGDVAAAAARVQAHGITPITEGGPQRLPANTGGVVAYKFRDPFGHPFELLAFPPGAGDPVWHGDHGDALFLGIDHTAIAVGDGDASRRFYTGQFGFTVASTSHNAGPEQVRLDAIPAVRVDVYGLAPQDAPPHLELLAYQTGLRRPRPEGWSLTDIEVTRTVLRVDGSGPPRRVVDPDGHVVIATPTLSLRGA